MRNFNETGTERCMQCGRCSASCPAAPAMDMPPHRWVYRIRNGDAATVQDCAAIWQCLSCLCCEERCPRGVRPAQLAEAARSAHLRAPTEIHKDMALKEISAQAADDIPQQLLAAALRKSR